MQFVADKDLSEFTEISNLSPSEKPIKSLLKSLHFDCKMKENGKESPVSNEKSIAGKSSNEMEKTDDIKNNGYQQLNG